MKKLGMMIAVIPLVLAHAASGSDGIEIEHEAPLPCSFACGYYDAGSALGNDACADPHPSGSYDQTIFEFDDEALPSSIVEVTASIEMDWDVFVCAATDPAVEVHASSCSSPRAAATQSCLGGDCTLGCDEVLIFTQGEVLDATDGETSDFIVRSFNWLDNSSARITVDGLVRVTDDSYDADLLG